MHEPDNSVADRLAAELEQDAEFVDAGGFDIDATRALAKLSHFQLANPRAYVLRLAEAGLLGGASRLRFDIEGTRMRATFEPSPTSVVLSKTTLERLTTVLVSRAPQTADAPPQAMLVQLAVAAVAILGLEPVWFAIESVAADGRGHRQVYAPEARGEALEGAVPGTRIDVHESVEIARVLEGFAGVRDEHQLLDKHCRHVRIPVVVDGKQIARQPLFAQADLVQRIFSLNLEVVGEAGFERDSSEPAMVRLLSSGLLIESKIMPGWKSGFRASLDLPLPRDLSQSRVIQSAELEAALELVADLYRRLVDQRAPAVVTRQAALAESTTSPPSLGWAFAGATVFAVVMCFVFGTPAVAIPAFAFAIIVAQAVS